MLHEDEVVVDKQTVAKERVRMGTETVSEDREISEEVRKEQIETDGDATSLTPRAGNGRRGSRACDPSRLPRRAGLSRGGDLGAAGAVLSKAECSPLIGGEHSLLL